MFSIVMIDSSSSGSPCGEPFFFRNPIKFIYEKETREN